MKKRVGYATLLLLFFTLQAKAVVTNWTGYGSGTLGGADVNNWFNPSNWSNGVPGSNDDVQIGVTGFYFNPPILSSSTSIKSLSFGVAYTSVALTVNSGVVLTVSNNITARYGSASTTINILGQTVGGSLGGTINCGGNFLVGDNTAPITPAPLGTINATYTVTVNVAIQNFNVANNLTLNTTSSTGNVAIIGTNTSSNVNNPVLNINNGVLNVSQNITETNLNYVNTALTGFPNATNSSRLILNPVTNTSATSTPTLAFAGSLTIGTGGTVDFNGTGSGTSTVNYLSANPQTVYTTVTGLDTSPTTYQNVGFLGAGVKAIQGGTMDLSGNWSSAGGKIDAISNSSVISFRGGNQTITDAGSNGGSGFIFGNVVFRGTGTKAISSGKFSVAGTAVLTMAGTATLSIGSSSTLTLLSTTAGTATVAALPLGTAITGNVNVQRLIKGSSTDLSKRGYRFISSSVYTGNVGGVKCFDLKYLLDSTYVSGMSGGGFNAPSTNPSLYLYREDIVPNVIGFSNSHFKGISKVDNANAYDIGTQKRLTTANLADTTINLPVGNGVLFFFRGNKSNNATQSGSKVTQPYDYPEDVQFTQVGQLNTGTVNVKPWYNFNNSSNPNNYLSYTNSSSVNNADIRGFMLVGNPYASTINWEKFNRNGTNSSIYGGGFPSASVTQGKIWMYNPTTKQYDTYVQAPTVSSVADTTTTVKPTGSIATGDASNMIASGQGFLIRATATGQTFSFRETAKTNAQPVAANLIRVMSAPSAINTMAFSSTSALAEPASSAPLSILGFKLIKDSINTDDAVLAFNNRTGDNFDAATDAEDLGGNGALVSLSITTADDKAVAIKQLTLPQTGKRVIKLFTDATSSGTYQLRLNKMENLPQAYDVWLKDGLINDSLDIKHNNTYTFNIDKRNGATYGSHRFTLVVSRNQAIEMRALSFRAEKEVQNAKLTWQTENEGNDYIFVIERSTDNGKTFKDLGMVASSDAGTYSFYDIQPLLGENQYKIRIEHKWLNNKQYTAITKLNYGQAVAKTVASSTVSVYPNPAADVINIKIGKEGENTETFTIKISNSFGLLINEIHSSQTNVQQNISSLTPGTYVVRVINSTENKVAGETKFVKVR